LMDNMQSTGEMPADVEAALTKAIEEFKSSAVY